MHQLQVLDQLVSGALSILDSSPGTQQVIMYHDHFDKALDQAAGLRAALAGQALAAKSKKELRLIIHHYQAFCIDISNRLCTASATMERLPYNDVAIKGMLSKQQVVQEHLLGLLQFLVDRFGEFFNHHQAMPVLQSEAALGEINTRVNELSIVLKEIEDKQLLNYIFSAVRNVTGRSPGTISYHDSECLKRYVASLEINIDSLKADPFNQFLEICISIDHIPPGFLNYYFQKQAEQLAGDSTIEVKAGWQRLLLRFTQVPLFISSGQASVKSAVIAAFREQVEQFDYLTPVYNPKHHQATSEKIFKTSMSVSQLAIFLRVLDKSGAIKSSNHTAMLKAVASSIHTSKATAISPESLRAKFYSSDPASVNIVKEYVINMMNQLRQY